MNPNIKRLIADSEIWLKRGSSEKYIVSLQEALGLLGDERPRLKQKIEKNISLNKKIDYQQANKVMIKFYKDSLRYFPKEKCIICGEKLEGCKIDEEPDFVCLVCELKYEEDVDDNGDEYEEEHEYEDVPSIIMICRDCGEEHSYPVDYDLSDGDDLLQTDDFGLEKSLDEELDSPTIDGCCPKCGGVMVSIATERQDE